MSLKKGGADKEVVRALRYLLATPEELQQTEQAGHSTGQWVSDILEYRQMPTALTPFNYITLSDATELRVQQVSCLDVIGKTTFELCAVCALIGIGRGQGACTVCFFHEMPMAWQMVLEVGLVGEVQDLRGWGGKAYGE